nr:acyltransferase family protein [Bacteroides sp.]
MTAGRKRILWIDIAKGLSIILVVYGHYGLSDVPFLTNWLKAFRIPFFFLVSGLLFDPDRYAGPLSLLRKRGATLIRPFIIFSIAVLAGFYLVSPQMCKEQISDFGSVGWCGYALWFIPVLLATQLLFLLICKALKAPLLRAAAITALAAGGFWLYRIDAANVWNLNFALTAVMFFGLGSLLSRPLTEFMESRPLRHILLWGGVCLLFTLGSIFNKPRPDYFLNHLGTGPLTYVTALSGALMLCVIANVISRATGRYASPMIFTLRYFGRNSYIVLAFHQVVALVLTSVFLIDAGPWMRALMWVILVVIIEAVTRCAPWIIGRKKCASPSPDKSRDTSAQRCR